MNSLLKIEIEFNRHYRRFMVLEPRTLTLLKAVATTQSTIVEKREKLSRIYRIVSKIHRCLCLWYERHTCICTLSTCRLSRIAWLVMDCYKCKLDHIIGCCGHKCSRDNRSIALLLFLLFQLSVSITAFYSAGVKYEKHDHSTVHFIDFISLISS